MDTNIRDNNRRWGCMIGNYTCMVHVIRPGDTLYRLSRQYGVKVSALMMANPFVDIYNLRIGDELCIPRLGRPDNMPMCPMMENMAETPSHMQSEEFYDNDEKVINVEMPMMEKNIDSGAEE